MEFYDRVRGEKESQASSTKSVPNVSRTTMLPLTMGGITMTTRWHNIHQIITDGSVIVIIIGNILVLMVANMQEYGDSMFAYG